MRNRKMTLMSPGYDSKSLHATLFSAQLLQQKCVLKTTEFLKNKTKENEKKTEENDEIIFFLSPFNRHAGVLQRQTTTTHRRHARTSVAFSHRAFNFNRKRKVVVVWNNRQQRSLG
jgi:hypothetical protein